MYRSIAFSNSYLAALRGTKGMYYHRALLSLLRPLGFAVRMSPRRPRSLMITVR